MRFSLLSLSLLSLLVLAQLSMVVHSRLINPQYPIEILSVETGAHVDGEWYPRTFFSHLESIEAVITLRVIDQSIAQVYLTFTAIDSEQHPVLFKLFIHTIGGNQIQEVSVNLGTLPNYSSLGDATLYSNVLSGLPSQGGKPLSPQNQRSFGVWWTSADVNRDYSVNVLDVVTVCASYGRSDSDPLWNARCDIATPYRYIDIYDLLAVIDDLKAQWSP